jgi:phosphodiesterase/alkaline phosphatase D-like protein
MKFSLHRNQFSRMARLSLVSAAIGLLSLAALPASAAVTFLGVASGDAFNTGATFWTRALDSTAPANTTLTLQITTDPTFATVTNTFSCTYGPVSADGGKAYMGGYRAERNVGPDNVLTPGKTATVVLQFNDPTRAAITYNTRVLGGVTP